ncbi:MAG: GUN4 domain-containing protein [Limnothrix sp.]
MSQKPKQQQSLEEKLTDIAYKVIMTGGVSVGGIGAFWQLFKASDIPKAIASAVIGVGIAYGAALLQPIHKGNKKRFGQMGEAANKGIDDVGEGLTQGVKSQIERWRGLDFESQYLQCQAWDCEEDEAIGLRDDEDLPVNSPLLQEVFVPLELSADAMLSGYEASQLRQEHQDGETVTQIWNLLRLVKKNKNFRQIAIRAWGGYGKTTLMKHLAYSYSVEAYKEYDAPKFTPFLIYLAGCWQEILTDESMTLPKLLSTYQLQRLPQGKELQPPENWAKDLLKQGQALVLFDGFDEIPPKERAQMSEWLSAAMNDYRDAVFFITSRPTAYRDDFVAKKPSTSFWVQDFNEKQRAQFVRQWYRCQEKTARGGRVTPKVEQIVEQRSKDLLAQIKARPELNDIAGNVLLLNMMARFHRDRNQAELPQRKVELYQDICELQLGRRPKGKGISLLLDSTGQRQVILQRLALEMMMFAEAHDTEDENFKQITKVDLLERLQGFLRQMDVEVEPKEFLYQLVTVSELMVERDRQIYQFAHLSFQEFLAAMELRRLGERGEKIVSDYLTINAWKDVILFYANLGDPEKLIKEALNQKEQTLAYLIYQQEKKKLKGQFKVSIKFLDQFQEIEKTILDDRYQRLEELLIAAKEDVQKWREADEETYRLMITAVGKDEGQLFSEQDLREFPCDELREIDRLWVKHSNGLYGFSVQKDIYVQCGGTLDYKYPDDKVFDKFYEAIAWREDGKSKVTWDEILDRCGRMGVQGHLPVMPAMGRYDIPLFSHPAL